MGKFEVYKEKENGSLELVGQFPNHFVNGGKQFMLDFAFNSVCWLSGTNGPGVWNGPRFIGVGYGTRTNNNLAGPTGGSTLPVDGPWQGVADNDYHLSDEMVGETTRAQCTCIRAGNTANLWTNIDNTRVTHNVDDDPLYITEIGIFICSGTTVGGDPTSTTATAEDREKTMICRGVAFDTIGDQYVYKPITKLESQTLKIKYIFSDFEG
jgi:hypothetical protein